ncbi:uncharacterized protein LOC141602226 [Silene latifolia]|uniref:uncharacterized protein LOC141602226 n=1 Tax=Silene latifolia TaxID=37657 RepID=UPI003D786192
MKPFNGKQELRNPPKILSGKEVYEKVKNIENNFGKPYKRTNNGTLYKKKSIFWDLPYWKHLSVRHCIDVMHVEKNVCDSIIGTLLNIICKVVDSDTLNSLQRDVITTMCQLEMFFPPSFFDIMQHLIVHLVREIKICGPVFLRNMYPFERYMKPLAGYVRNQNRPEGCMIQGYVAEEALDFANDYMSDVESIGLPTSRHEGRIEGQGTLGRNVVTVNPETLAQAHFYILQHMVDVHPYLEKHQTLLSAENPDKGERWLTMEHNRSFVKWFTNEVDIELINDREKVSDEVRWLAHGPGMHVLTYQGYDINGYSFYTKDQDDRSTMQNSGVALMAMSMSVASAKDSRPAYDAQPYFGVIKEIWELDYVQFRIPVFRCMWVEHSKGVRVDEMGFTLVDFSREGYKSEPFIMANQARQIFYVTDPANGKWSVVLHGKKKFLGKEIMDEVDDELPPFSSGLPTSTSTEDVDDFYLRDDHQEGLWVDD